MRSFIIILFCVCATSTYAGRDTVMVNGTMFEFRTKGNLSTAGEGIVSELTVSRLNNGKLSKLLTHTLHEDWRDCNSISITLGTYKVVDTTLVFYTYFAKTGDAMVQPCGVQKQVFVVDKSGTVSFIGCELYFNDYGMITTESFDGFYDESEPESVKAFQEHYGGDFLEGAAAQALDEEVRSLMTLQIEKHVHPLANNYDFSEDNSFGYCW